MADVRTCQKVCRHTEAPSIVKNDCNSKGAWPLDLDTRRDNSKCFLERIFGHGRLNRGLVFFLKRDRRKSTTS